MLASAWELLVHCLPLLVNACVLDSMHPRLFKPFQETISRHVRIQVAANIPNIACIHGKITNRRKLECELEDINRPPSFSFITDDPLWSTYYVHSCRDVRIHRWSCCRASAHDTTPTCIDFVRH